MKTINVKKIIENSEVSKKDIAEALFPKANHAVTALNNVSNGKQLLNTEQVVSLSNITGIPISELFTDSE